MAEQARVFEYVIFFNPKDEDETPEVLDNGMLVATNAEKARFKAMRLIDSAYDEQVDSGEVEVLVRPF